MGCKGLYYFLNAKLSGSFIHTCTIFLLFFCSYLLIAALSATGKSIIHNIEQIERGYQDIDTRLNALGADIRRI